jgi:hypothetical protein
MNLNRPLQVQMLRAGETPALQETSKAGGQKTAATNSNAKLRRGCCLDKLGQPFDPARRDLRMNRPAGRFTSSVPTQYCWNYGCDRWRSEARRYNANCTAPMATFLPHSLKAVPRNPVRPLITRVLLREDCWDCAGQEQG